MFFLTKLIENFYFQTKTYKLAQFTFLSLNFNNKRKKKNITFNFVLNTNVV